MNEKLKDMSPEEIAALQKQNCIFCHIVSGKVPSKKIHEDDVCLAVLDINPANPGHILLLPKEHYMIMPQIPEDVMAHLAIITKQLSSACLKSFKCDGTNIFVANGPAAGQKAQHFMIHIIPRFENDGVNIKITENKVSEADLKKVKGVIQHRVNEIFNIKGQESPKKEEAKEGKSLEEKPPIQEKEDSKSIPFKEKIEELEKEVEETEEILDVLSGKEPEKKKDTKNKIPKTKKKSKKKPNKEKTKNKEEKEVNLDDIASLFG